MKTKTTPKKSDRAWLSDFAATLRGEAGKTVPGFYTRSEDPKARRIYWRRAAAVQAVYDQAPAGAVAIADAVWRKLQSFRPKLTAQGLDDLISSRFRLDVTCILYDRVSRIRNREREAAQAADDARRAARARKGGRHG